MPSPEAIVEIMRRGEFAKYKSSTAMVYVFMLSVVGQTWTVVPINTIAEKVNVCPRSVMRALATLTREGKIRKRRCAATSCNEYLCL